MQFGTNQLGHFLFTNLLLIVSRKLPKLGSSTFLSLKEYNETTYPRGETLPEQQQVYRVKVVSAFLKAGVQDRLF